jgi:hypothetical protein
VSDTEARKTIMRLPSVSIVRYLVILLALGVAAHAYADDRGDARSHYQAGMKYYGSGDYRGAIREFSAAQQLAPADLNNYNLALCYDKLGDPEPAIQYYRAFLDKQPGTDKRAEIEASINRLEAAARSVSDKKADEARRADEARQADAARRPAPPVLGPDPQQAPGPVAGPTPPAQTPDAPEVRQPRRGPAVAGSIGTPGNGTSVSTGDPQLDRARAIDVDQVRDQRLGATGNSIPETRDGQLSGGPGEPPPVAANGNVPGNNLNAPSGGPVPGNDKPHESPVYTKWWFWVVVGVSAFVVVDIASSDSKSSASRGLVTGTSGGATLLRW